MPLKGLTGYVSHELVLAFLAASGGIARVITGTTPVCHRTTWLGETGRVVFVAMPVGIMSAMYVATFCQVASVLYATSFTAGIISLNIVRFIGSPEGFKTIKEFIINILGGGKK